MNPTSSGRLVEAAKARGVDASERCSPRKSPPRASPRATLVFATLAVLLAGCGHGLFAIHERSAAVKLAEARELGAPDLAAYEYYYAEAHFEQAKREAAEADYGDAVDLAVTSERYAEKAVELSRQAREGAGR
jgi:hypothetical protein